jgi:hypothetical protein
MLAVLAEFLLGFSAGCLISAVEGADEEATRRTIAQAQRRVTDLRDEADARVGRIHDRYGAWMSPTTRTAYRRRFGL